MEEERINIAPEETIFGIGRDQLSTAVGDGIRETEEGCTATGRVETVDEKRRHVSKKLRPGRCPGRRV